MKLIRKSWIYRCEKERIYSRVNKSRLVYMLEKRKDFLATLCYEYNVDILYVFGSRAKEVGRWIEGEIDCFSFSYSDIDMGMEPLAERKLQIKEKVQFTIALEEFFNVPRVDLVVIPEADPFLAVNIIRGERVFCRDTYRADEYELYILRRAGDLAPLERERLALIMGKK
jgi:hypothetical protein